MRRQEPPTFSISDLLERHSKRITHYTRQYSDAESIRDLLSVVIEPLAISAAVYYTSLNPPRRGRLILKALKHLKPSSYVAFWEKSNTILVECVLLLLGRFREFCEQNYQTVIAEDDFWGMAGRIGYFLFKECGPIDEEKEEFKHVLLDSLEDYFLDPPKDDKARLERIRRVCDVGSKAMVRLIIESVDALPSIGYKEFTAHYRRLKAIGD
ncbi:MAG: hypothetical protein ABIH23_06025 [bacterium]